MHLRMLAAGAVVSAVIGLAEAGVRTSATEVVVPSIGPAVSLAVVPEQAPRAPLREPSPLTPQLRARGYNACWVPENGFGSYSHWQRISMGQMIMPLSGGHTADGGYDVVLHFHGHEAVRHAFVEVARGAVLVGIDLGNSSGPYEKAFEDPSAFPRLLDGITRGLVRQSGDPHAHIRHLALSSWSAGYGAVRRILSRYTTGIDAVVLLDSLHSGYEPRTSSGGAVHRVAGAPIAPLGQFAARAAAGDVIFYLSHSAIVPPGYASTSEVADYIINEVGGVRSPRQGVNPLGAELVSGFDRRGMHVRGYLGGDKPAHCAHAELLAEAVRDYLEPAWETPSAP
jgi:hypothetical protein